jgi:hypothetical protein
MLQIASKLRILWSKPKNKVVPSNTLDQYLAAKVILPVHGVPKNGQIIKWKQHYYGHPASQPHDSPMLDTWEYIVIFDDAKEAKLTNIVIAKHLYTQVNSNSQQHWVGVTVQMENGSTS